MQDSLTRELLERLYVQHEKALYNIVYRWVWNAQEAQDLVQEGFLKLWEARSRVDSESVEAYLYRVVLNLAAKRHRWHKLRRFLPGITLANTADEQEERDGLHHLERERAMSNIRLALNKLPHRSKQTLMLCEFSEFSYEQIAKILNIPVGTVGSRRTNALRSLRFQLERQDGNDNHE